MRRRWYVLVFAFVLVPFGAVARRNDIPPNMPMNVQELFGRWLRTSGGEAAWKGLIDIEFDLTNTTSFMGQEVSKRTRHVNIKLQPRLRMKAEFVDDDGKRTIFGRDGAGWFKYREDVPVGQGMHDWRKPNVYDDQVSQDEVSLELKGIGFWLGLPFLLQQPGAKLRFAGFLRPGDETNPPYPIVEVDLVEVGDWPIDMVIVALDPADWQPIEARYRFRGEDDMPYTVRFFDFTTIQGIRYPQTRLFYKDDNYGERSEVMTNVRANTWIHQDEFTRPGWREQWTRRR